MLKQLQGHQKTVLMVRINLCCISFQIMGRMMGLINISKGIEDWVIRASR